MAAGGRLCGLVAAVVVLWGFHGVRSKMTLTPYRVTLPYDGVVKAKCFLSTYLPSPCKLEIRHGQQLLMVGLNTHNVTKDLGNIDCSSAGIYCCKIQYPDSSSTGCQKNSQGHFTNVNVVNSCNSLLVTPESKCPSERRRHLSTHERNRLDAKSHEEKHHLHRHHRH